MFKEYLAFIPFLILEKTYLFLPRYIFNYILKFLINLIYAKLKLRRKVVARNIDIAFPNLTDIEKINLIKDFYFSKGSFIQAWLELKNKPIKKIIPKIVTNNLRQLQEAHAKRGMVIVICAHYDYFHLPFLLPYYGIPTSFFAIHHSNPFYRKWIMDSITRFGGNVIVDSKKNGFVLQKELTKGNSLGLAVDLNSISPTAKFENFFNRPASFGTGAYRLALINKIPLFFVNGTYQNDQKYIMDFSAMITDFSNIKTRQDRLATLDRLVADFSRKLEKIVTKQPAKYFWSNRRWKTQPPGYTNPYQNL
ncbi:MAG: hypothetical protein JJV97_05220 [SAR324 cluster bacterium]|nr:hypothetical protein [SAR324 cluster bacterium]